MTTQFFKTVLAGILAGVALFMVPFVILRILIFFLLIKAIFRLLGGRGYRQRRFAYIKARYDVMSEEERSAFGHRHHCGWPAPKKEQA